MLFLVQNLHLAVLAVLIQVLAALPWLIVLALKLRRYPTDAADRTMNRSTGFFNGGVLGGIAVIAIAVGWFLLGLARDRVYIYPPILLVLGVLQVVKGLAELRGPRIGVQAVGYVIGGILATAVVASVLIGMGQDRQSLQYAGGAYGALLHLQLTIDFFVVVFALLFLAWPKGAAVALAAFREGWRQPMFWLITGLALMAMLISPWLPYFTLEQGDERHVGGDFKMVKELGYDFTMLAAALFGVLASSMSIAEEIEGRTAITLMSKPVSRRQFLLGKFVGILLAAFIITGALSWIFDGTLLLKIYYDKEVVRIPPDLEDATLTWQKAYGEVPAYFLRGAGFWMYHAASAIPGVILGFCQVMVLTAIAVALATRLPMVVNLVVCLVVFFLGHLAPVLQQAALGKGKLVPFMAQLIDYLTPALELFNLGPVIVRDTPPPTGEFSIYIAMVSFYAALYTTIALLVGLILFEDRDLA